jgi:hypothetical protein
MARIGARATIGLLFALSVALMVAPLLGRAGAQPGPSLLQAPTTATTRPATTTITTATTLPLNPTPTSAPATTKPTTVVTRPRVVTTTTSSTVAPTTTSTTLAPLPAPAPAPVTLPLATASQSGNISAVFPILSGFGFVVLIGLLTAQWFLTKPGRRGPTL